MAPAIGQGKQGGGFDRIFEGTYGWSFILLIVLLAFASFRPDRLITGGDILIHFPNLIKLLLVLIWIKTPGKYLGNKQTKLYLAFIALMIIQVPFARNAGHSITALKGIVIYGITTYLFKIQFIDNHYKVTKYIKIYLTLSVFLAILGIMGKGKIRIPVLQDENDFCLLMNMLIPFAWFFAQLEKEKRKKVFYYLIMTTYVIANIATFSRGGFVGLVFVGFFLWYKSSSRVSAIVMSGIAVIVILLFATPEYWSEIKTIEIEGIHEGTGKARIDYWKAGWKMFLDHPVIGVGSLNYGQWLPDYFEGNKKMWGRVAHSLYITLLSEMGIIGVLLFFGVLQANFRDYRYISNLEKQKNKLIASAGLKPEDSLRVSQALKELHFVSLAIAGSMLAYLVTGAFISVLWYGYFWMLSAFWVMTKNIAEKIETMLLGHNQDAVMAHGYQKTPPSEDTTETERLITKN